MVVNQDMAAITAVACYKPAILFSFNGCLKDGNRSAITHSQLLFLKSLQQNGHKIAIKKKESVFHKSAVSLRLNEVKLAIA